MNKLNTSQPIVKNGIADKFEDTDNNKNNDNNNNNDNSKNNTGNVTRSLLDRIKDNDNYKLTDGKYMCNTDYIQSDKLGYANETETNDYMHLDTTIAETLNSFNYENTYTDEDKGKLSDFKKYLQELETQYEGLELIYMKNNAYSNFMNSISSKPNTYLQLPNVDPKNDPIHLTDVYPKNRKLLTQELTNRHINTINNYYKDVNNNDTRLLQKYGWLNEMGNTTANIATFNLTTDNNDIINYNKQFGRLPQDILTDYNPITNCKRLTRECVTRIAPNYPLKPMDRQDYEKYLDKIKEDGYVDKYYEVLGMD
jgi:hypothetical protein